MMQAMKKITALYNRILVPFGLTVQQAMALGIIVREQELSLGRFAKQAGVGKAAAVAMIKRLESMGYVTRDPDPTDARLIVIRLTDKTRDLAQAITSDVRTLETELESAIGGRELRSFLEMLTTVRDLEL